MCLSVSLSFIVMLISHHTTIVGTNLKFFCSSYAVASGLIEILSRRCMKIRESVEVHQSVVLSLLATIGLLTKVIDVCPPGEFNDPSLKS